MPHACMNNVEEPILQTTWTPIAWQVDLTLPGYAMYIASGRRVMRRLLLGGSKDVASSALMAILPSAVGTVLSSGTSHPLVLVVHCTSTRHLVQLALCYTSSAAFRHTVIKDELLRDAGDALTPGPLADVFRQARPACAVEGRPSGAPLSRALQCPGLPDVEQCLRLRT
jgi:hypothetical protein